MRKCKVVKRIAGVAIFFLITACGPVVYTSIQDRPPPAWFYPNRVELVRYVYFPDHHIYFDLSLNQYIYLNAGIWTRTPTLPRPYQHLDLRRSRYQRVNGYRSENIGRYHEEQIKNRGRSNKNTNRKKPIGGS